MTLQRTSFLWEAGRGGEVTSKEAGQSLMVTGRREEGLLGDPGEPGLEKGEQNQTPH